MAAFDHFRDLYDVALKPRLLHSLLKEQVPDEKRPFQNHLELSSIVSTVKIHKLLAESLPDLVDQKHISTRRSAVDTWVDRILSLAGSNLPDKCWAGVCLLGVTCTQCSCDRFLASYSDWFNALFSHIQPPGVSQFIKVASCAAVSDLLTRLGRFSNLKKDATSLAGKLVQPLLNILNEDDSEVLLEVATDLLSTILTYFPSSVQRHHDNAEGAIVSKIMSGNCSANLSKKLACCLALLPKSRGDEESWSLFMQKILLSVSALLNDALEGLEDESRRAEAVALLVPPGKDPPLCLGGRMMVGDSLKNGERSPQLLSSSISSLMQCCCTMLTSSYPVQVTVPFRPLLAIIGRVIMVNGSLPEALQPFTTVMQQEFVCSQLPVLHLCMLEVLAALVEGLHSQLLPHAAYVIQLLMDYMNRCWLPELRTKVYSIIRVLMVSMGCGMALYMSQEVIHNVSIDLKISCSRSDGAQSYEQTSVEATQQPRKKKRKHGAATGHLVEQNASFSSEVKEPKEHPALIPMKIAAIEALEALLFVAGALRSDSWRRKVDHLLIEVATNACRGGWAHDEKPFLPEESRLAWENFQLAALHALWASLLSPAGIRPPYLAQGLELFRKGKRATGTKVAELCGRALLSLEVLVHPRALPLIDSRPLPNENNYYSFDGPKHKSPHPDGIYGNSHDVYDFLNDIYQENTQVQKVVHCDEKLLDNSQEQIQNVEEPIVNGSSSDKMTLDVQIEEIGDRIMLDLQNHDHDEPAKTSQEPPVSHGGVTASPPVDSPLTAKMGLGEDNGSMTRVPSVATAQEDNNTLKPSTMEVDDDESFDFPDIVDEDPDTNSDSDSD